MKTLIIALSCLLSLSVSASVYQCRSYNLGGMIVVDEEMAQIILQDRFGNELDIMDDVTSETDVYTEDSMLVKTTYFNSDGKPVFILDEQDGKIKGTYKDDNSYQCKYRY